MLNRSCRGLALFWTGSPRLAPVHSSAGAHIDIRQGDWLWLDPRLFLLHLWGDEPLGPVKGGA